MFQRFLTASIFIILTIMITGCHPVPKKTFSYMPPQTASEVGCMNKCYYARKNCTNICVLKNKPYCDCVTSFNTCYSACGGYVIPRITTRK